MPILRYWDPTSNSWQPLTGTGPAGPQGPPGANGTNGATGATGSQGPQGAQGNAGPAGPVGPAGSIGPAGPAGADGPVGPPGATSDEVFIGPAQPTSPPSLQIWFDDDATPTPMPQGPPGPQGVAGPTGAAGPTGPAGPTGANGTSVTIKGSVPSTAALPPTGSPGDGYITADTGHLWVWSGTAWVDAGVIQGPPGATGPTGPKGDKGDPGSSDWADITNKPTTFAPATHNHDASYYTKAEMPTKFARSADGSVWDISYAAGRVRWYGGGNYLGDMATTADLSLKCNGWADVNDSRYTEGPYPTAYNRTVAGGGFFAVWMDNGMQFGRNTSSARYKENIRDHDIDPAKVLRLQPKMFDRKAQPRAHADIPGETELVEGQKDEYGLIAEEVFELVPEIVTFFDDEIDGIRYDLLAVALLHVVKDLSARMDAWEDA